MKFTFTLPSSTMNGSNGNYIYYSNLADVSYTMISDEWMVDEEMEWMPPSKLTPQDVDVLKCALQAEETLEQWLIDNYDRYELMDCGGYIYDITQEQAYTVVSDIIEKLAKDVNMECEDEEAIIQAVLENIDFDSLYTVAEDIINAPITMEEKLAEVGMSYRDFL